MGGSSHNVRHYNRLSPQEGHTINNAEGFLEDARKTFSLAAKATGQKEIERFAAMGGDYLGLAHEAAKLDATPRVAPSLFP